MSVFIIVLGELIVTIGFVILHHFHHFQLQEDTPHLNDPITLTETFRERQPAQVLLGMCSVDKYVVLMAMMINQHLIPYTCCGWWSYQSSYQRRRRYTIQLQHQRRSFSLTPFADVVILIRLSPSANEHTAKWGTINNNHDHRCN